MIYFIKKKYEPIQTLQAHTDNVCVADAMWYIETSTTTSNNKQLQTILASSSVDSTVRIWARHSDFNFNNQQNERALFACDQVIKSKANGFALALKFYLLPLAKCILFNFF